MVDAPGRARPRFPPALEQGVATAIARELDALRPGAADVATGSAACGSDLLFAEALLARGVPLRLYLPFPADQFIEKSVAFAGDDWVARFDAVTRRAHLQVATEALGPLPAGADPYERTNLWMLDEARRVAGAALVFLCVWNGEGGDGPGGTQHLMDAVRTSGGDVRWIDTRTL
jgi:hypothetical protein